MSDVNIPANDGELVIPPRPSAATGGDFTLPADYTYPQRQVIPVEAARAGTGTGFEQQNFQPVIGPTDPRIGQFYRYSGPNLVNENGVIARSAYDPDEAYSVLANLNRAERIALQTELYARGLYDGARPSTSGFDSQDITAMKQLLLAANRYGVTADKGLRSPAMAYLRSEFPVVEKPSGARVRVTAREDIEKVLRDESLRLLGRAMTPAEVREAVQFVQNQQVSRAGGAEQAPSLSTQATQAVTRGRGQEVAVQGAVRTAQLIEKLIGS